MPQNVNSVLNYFVESLDDGSQLFTFFIGTTKKAGTVHEDLIWVEVSYPEDYDEKFKGYPISDMMLGYAINHLNCRGLLIIENIEEERNFYVIDADLIAYHLKSRTSTGGMDGTETITFPLSDFTKLEDIPDDFRE